MAPLRTSPPGPGWISPRRGMGAFAGDVNNDGLPDLLVTEYGAIHLFENLGSGKFREITARLAWTIHAGPRRPASSITIAMAGSISSWAITLITIQRTSATMCRDSRRNSAILNRSAAPPPGSGAIQQRSPERDTDF